VVSNAIGTARRQMDPAPRRAIRVLVVVRHPVGGIRTYLKYTYGALPSGKYRFTVLAVRSLETSHLRRDLEQHALDYVEVPEGRRPTLALLRSIRASLGNPPDVIHSHGFTSGAIAALANLRHGIPHVITSHDVFRSEQFQGWRGRVKAAAMTAILGNADVVQSVSADAQANLLEFLPGIDRGRLAIIPNGIDVDKFYGSATRTRHQTIVARTNERFAFGFFGRLMPQKGFGDLVDAVAALDRDPAFRGNFLIRVVADGGYIREHRAELASRGLAPYFEFSGFMPDISRAMASVDAVVMPSLWEACPLLAMETLVSGCPLIAARCIGLREVVSGTPALGVTPGAPAELAEAMRSVMSNYGRIKEATLTHMDRARCAFDVRTASRRLDALLDSLVGSGGKICEPARRALQRSQSDGEYCRRPVL